MARGKRKRRGGEGGGAEGRRRGEGEEYLCNHCENYDRGPVVLDRRR